MDFLKFFIKDEVPAVGLSSFRDEGDKKYTYNPSNNNYNLNRRIFSANYTKNFFLM